MRIHSLLASKSSHGVEDWDARDTEIANLTNATSSGTKSSADNLWEDNWDDDDVEDDFSKQLR